MATVILSMGKAQVIGTAKVPTVVSQSRYVKTICPILQILTFFQHPMLKITKGGGTFKDVVRIGFLTIETLSAHSPPLDGYRLF